MTIFTELGAVQDAVTLRCSRQAYGEEMNSHFRMGTICPMNQVSLGDKDDLRRSRDARSLAPLTSLCTRVLRTRVGGPEESTQSSTSSVQVGSTLGGENRTYPDQWPLFYILISLQTCYSGRGPVWKTLFDYLGWGFISSYILNLSELFLRGRLHSRKE